MSEYQRTTSAPSTRPLTEAERKGIGSSSHLHTFYGYFGDVYRCCWQKPGSA